MQNYSFLGITDLFQALSMHFVTFYISFSVPMMVPKTTSETLKHKINPSAGETFPQAIDVLLYTPGEVMNFSVLALISL